MERRDPGDCKLVVHLQNWQAKLGVAISRDLATRLIATVMIELSSSILRFVGESSI